MVIVVPTLAERLKQARLSRSLTLEQVAEALETSYPTIWRYEAGQRNPSGPVLYALATLYAKPVEWFFGEDEVTSPDPSDTASDPEQSDIEVEREFVMNAASLALRAASPNLSDESIRLIADYIRFVEERECRENGG